MPVYPDHARVARVDHEVEADESDVVQRPTVVIDEAGGDLDPRQLGGVSVARDDEGMSRVLAFDLKRFNTSSRHVSPRRSSMEVVLPVARTERRAFGERLHRGLRGRAVRFVVALGAHVDDLAVGTDVEGR